MSQKYMSEEGFNLLVESLNQAIEYERGERDDLRVTVVPVPPQPGFESAIASIEDGDEKRLEALYAEFADEDHALAENGMDDHLKNLTLEELLEGITDENRHNEIDIGPSVGKEEW